MRKARSKRTGQPYHAPAVRGFNVCRMHGAGGGAPNRNRNALKHGQFTCEAIAMRRELAELVRDGRRLDELIGVSFEQALLNLRSQFSGAEDGYFFDPKIKTFKGWFLGVVGYPGKRRLSGVAGSEFNRLARERARQGPFEDALHVQSQDARSIEGAREPRQDALEWALTKLRPRPAFVLRASYGVHGERLLDPTGIKRLALFVKLDDPSPRQLHRRAQLLFSHDHLPSEKLSDGEIGALLEIGDRQIRNIKKAAIAELRHRIL
jgi:hypothetical protein